LFATAKSNRGVAFRYHRMPLFHTHGAIDYDDKF
jgi:hypothetical protein